jgi:hypothetical protein
MWYISCLGIHVLCLWISCFDLSKNICIEHIIHLIFKSFKYIYFFLFLIWNIISFIYRKKYQGYKQVNLRSKYAWPGFLEKNWSLYLSFCSDSKKYLSWDFSKIPFLETNLGKTQLSFNLRIMLMFVRGLETPLISETKISSARNTIICQKYSEM